MEATREIYWNVGHGVTPLMYLLAFLSMGVCAWGFYRRLPFYLMGQPLNRLDALSRRAAIFLKNTFGQIRVREVPVPGTQHALFFWGFLLLFIGTLLVMVQADFTDPLFALRFLKGKFYLGFKIVLNAAGIAAILTMLGLGIRRFIGRPEGLVTAWDDYVIHLLLLVILVTGFCVEGVRMAVTELHQNPWLARFSFGGLPVAHLMDGIDPDTQRAAHRFLWWFHFLLAMSFIVLIPFTKLKHLFTTPANYLFTDLRPKGAIDTIDLEDESRETYGVAGVNEFTWKHIYDADACMACKRCQDRCPAWQTGKPLSPMKVVQQVGEVAFGAPRENLVEKVTRDVLWACTTCRACQTICPAHIEHVNKILEMRRHLALMQGEFPGDEVRAAEANYEVNGNPFGIAPAARGDWRDGLDLAVAGEGDEFDVLYFVGCYASFDKRNQAVARNFSRICAAAGIKVGILGKEEVCCGEPSRKLGNEYLYQMQARQNIETMQGYQVKKVVTTCPHCFNTLARDYRDLGFEAEVEHYTTFLDRLIADGKLGIKPQELNCTYHDSCYLGRYMDIYAAPRRVLDACGASIAEMDKSRHESFCCGGGGGRILAEERIGTRISEARIGMAAATGAPVLVANCPFCLTMFEDGIKTGGFEEKIQVQDLAEVVLQRLNLPG
ncbi:heterodisulfide reductase-related iron-sulfur binding cluster [Geomesophilobacter sediminis]|uniref:4Fe-4S dicluster domain-containing protein n=1 Tax=Geomesophilobacter sediminis TaxID=2798584 RepID=A0A8J7JH83_9BACT|nr:heterodisulfide reductase-related iron-sulfur binding cluster [Geomesophilobacter sediminis]MBJ6723840.1 4Fe-4S dicluster domain-containing protein [Geomesophilobacter sediminis]